MIIGRFGLQYHPRTVEEQDMIYDFDPVEAYGLDIEDEYDRRKELIQRLMMLHPAPKPQTPPKDEEKK